MGLFVAAMKRIILHEAFLLEHWSVSGANFQNIRLLYKMRAWQVTFAMFCFEG